MVVTPLHCREYHACTDKIRTDRVEEVRVDEVRETPNHVLTMSSDMHGESGVARRSIYTCTYATG